jgi:hypothetical protein
MKKTILLLTAVASLTMANFAKASGPPGHKVVEITTVVFPADQNYGPCINTYALCDDGTLWFFIQSSQVPPNNPQWKQLQTP